MIGDRLRYGQLLCTEGHLRGTLESETLRLSEGMCLED